MQKQYINGNFLVAFSRRKASRLAKCARGKAFRLSSRIEVVAKVVANATFDGTQCANFDGECTVATACVLICAFYSRNPSKYDLSCCIASTSKEETLL